MRVDLFGIYIKLFSLQRSKPYFIIPHTGRLSGLPPVTLRAQRGLDLEAWRPKVLLPEDRDPAASSLHYCMLGRHQPCEDQRRGGASNTRVVGLDTQQAHASLRVLSRQGHQTEVRKYHFTTLYKICHQKTKKEAIQLQHTYVLSFSV